MITPRQVLFGLGRLHGVLTDPAVKFLSVKLRAATHLDEWNAALADHGVEG